MAEPPFLKSNFKVNSYDTGLKNLAVEDMTAFFMPIGRSLYDEDVAQPDGAQGYRYQEIVGVEALARWRGDTNLSPTKFTEYFKSTRQLSDMDLQIIGEAVKLATRHPDIFVSVNASIESLQTHGFANEVEKLCLEYGVPPEQIKIEMLEDPMNDRLKHIVYQNLKQMSENGHEISLDDFGTGNSDAKRLLECLENGVFINNIKIDMSVTRNEELFRAEAEALLKIIADYKRTNADKMEDKEIHFIVEGSEEFHHDGQAVNLLGHNVLMQGYMVQVGSLGNKNDARAMSPEATDAFLAQRKDWRSEKNDMRPTSE